MVLLLLLPLPAVQSSASIETVPAAPGEFLARSMGSQHGALAASTRVSASWALFVDERTGSPSVVAEQLSRELGLLVVPNRLVDLAQTEEPRFEEQWALENTGQTGGSPGADIGATEAWALAVGDPTVVVAIIDTGIDRVHPDLTDRLWNNPGEVAANGVDDDGNGFVDDIQGWDFLEGDSDPSDSHGHGTAVAGIAAASVNEVGMVGVAPGIRIMPLRACSSSCPMSSIVASVDYAVQQGADVINLSLGGFGSAFEPLADALRAADEAGVLVVAAAGNTGSDNDVNPYLPASFELDNIISAGATDHNDRPADFSNYGADSVDVGAPGVDVLTSVVEGWDSLSGTSFSSSYVAGTAALVLSVDPLRRPGEIRRILIDTADPIAQLAGSSVSGGRLNAGAAVWEAGGPVASIVVAASDETAPTSVRLDGSGSYDPTGSPLEYSWTLDGDPIGDRAIVDLLMEDHLPHVAELEVVDGDALRSRTSITIDLNGAPTVLITPPTALVLAPSDLTFRAAASDPDGDPLTIDWAIAGEPIGQGAEIAARFALPGIFELEAAAGDGTTQSTAVVAVLVGEDYLDTRSSVYSMDAAWASATGLTSGCGPGRFCPDAPLTRGQAAAFLTRHLGLGSGPDAFSDDDGNSFERDIDAIAQAGITVGCRALAFCPNLTITRGQWAAMLVRTLDLPPGRPGRFVDDDGSIFELEIEALAAAGITFGCNPPANDRFCPSGQLTRGQAVAMLHRTEALDGH